MPFSMSFFWNGVNSRADTQLENTSIFPKKILNQIIQQWSYSSFHVILKRHSNEFANQFIYSFSIKLCSEIFVVVCGGYTYALFLLLHAIYNSNKNPNEQQPERNIQQKKKTVVTKSDVVRGKKNAYANLPPFYSIFFFDNFTRLLSWVFFSRHFIVVILFHIDISRLIGMMWRLVWTRHFPTFVVQIEQIE